MDLLEAKQILNNNGFVLESSMKLKDKIQGIIDFNDENRKNAINSFGELMVKKYLKNVWNVVKEKALKAGFDKQYIKDCYITMKNYTKDFDFFVEFLMDKTENNNDCEQLSVDELIDKYGDNAIKYSIKTMYNYYFR